MSKRLPSSTKSQRERIIDRLKEGPVTTQELREELEILSPTARMSEIKKMYGCEIHTMRVDYTSPSGTTRKIAQYVMTRSPAFYV